MSDYHFNPYGSFTQHNSSCVRVLMIRAMFERSSADQTDFDLVFGLKNEKGDPVLISEVTIDFTGSFCYPSLYYCYCCVSVHCK
jgi:hypothetical protein